MNANRRSSAVGWAIAVTLAGWGAMAIAGWPSRRAIPTPRAMMATAWNELSSTRIWRDVGATGVRVIAGVVVAAILGGVLGLALGAGRTRWRAAQPVVDFLRSVPPILTFPWFLLALGFGEASRFATVVFGTTGIVLLHVGVALDRTPEARRDAARWMGLRGWAAFRHALLPEALPGWLTGVQVAISAGLVIAVVTEMLIGARDGLGARALEAQIEYRADVLWLVMVLAGTLGMGLSSAVAWAGRRFAPWT